MLGLRAVIEIPMDMYVKTEADSSSQKYILS